MRRLWYHGKVDTMVPGHPRQQAIGMEDGTIVFVGSDRDALPLPWDEKTDLGGRQVLPGFTDTHIHLLLYALFRDSLPLVGVPSIEAIIERGKAKLAGTGASYLLGMGWNQETLAEGRMPTRADLDQISREIPICLLRTCAHVAACNTPMLERLKTLPGVEDSVLEKVDFDQGLLREEAMRLYMQVVPPLSDEEVKDLIRKGQADANAKGLTCVQARDPWPQARHGAVHVQITDPALLKRMKALGFQAYIQPIFIEADMGIITQRVGEKRAQNCYNWRSMLELGIPVSGGSDCPVEPFDVLDNLRAAVTRQDRAGERTYLPQQALSLFTQK